MTGLARETRCAWCAEKFDYANGFHELGQCKKCAGTGHDRQKCADTEWADSQLPTLSEMRGVLKGYVVESDEATEIESLRAEVSRLTASLAALQQDADRIDWLEKRAVERERVEIGFNEAWTETGDYGSVLSSGPREFWLSDNGDENGPTLRDALDAARGAARSEPDDG